MVIAIAITEFSVEMVVREENYSWKDGKAPTECLQKLSPEEELYLLKLRRTIIAYIGIICERYYTANIRCAGRKLFPITLLNVQDYVSDKEPIRVAVAATCAV